MKDSMEALPPLAPDPPPPPPPTEPSGIAGKEVGDAESSAPAFSPGRDSHYEIPKETVLERAEETSVMETCTEGGDSRSPLKGSDEPTAGDATLADLSESEAPSSQPKADSTPHPSNVLNESVVSEGVLVHSAGEESVNDCLSPAERQNVRSDDGNVQISATVNSPQAEESEDVFESAVDSGEGLKSPAKSEEGAKSQRGDVVAGKDEVLSQVSEEEEFSMALTEVADERLISLMTNQTETLSSDIALSVDPENLVSEVKSPVILQENNILLESAENFQSSPKPPVVSEKEEDSPSESAENMESEVKSPVVPSGNADNVESEIKSAPVALEKDKDPSPNISSEVRLPLTLVEEDVLEEGRSLESAEIFDSEEKSPMVSENDEEVSKESPPESPCKHLESVTEPSESAVEAITNYAEVVDSKEESVAETAIVVDSGAIQETDDAPIPIVERLDENDTVLESAHVDQEKDTEQTVILNVENKLQDSEKVESRLRSPLTVDELDSSKPPPLDNGLIITETNICIDQYSPAKLSEKLPSDITTLCDVFINPISSGFITSSSVTVQSVMCSTVPVAGLTEPLPRDSTACSALDTNVNIEQSSIEVLQSDPVKLDTQEKDDKVVLEKSPVGKEKLIDDVGKDILIVSEGYDLQKKNAPEAKSEESSTLPTSEYREALLKDCETSSTEERPPTDTESTSTNVVSVISETPVGDSMSVEDTHFGVEECSYVDKENENILQTDSVHFKNISEGQCTETQVTDQDLLPVVIKDKSLVLDEICSVENNLKESASGCVGGAEDLVGSTEAPLASENIEVDFEACKAIDSVAVSANVTSEEELESQIPESIAGEISKEETPHLNNNKSESCVNANDGATGLVESQSEGCPTFVENVEKDKCEQSVEKDDGDLVADADPTKVTANAEDTGKEEQVSKPDEVLEEPRVSVSENQPAVLKKVPETLEVPNESKSSFVVEDLSCSVEKQVNIEVEKMHEAASGFEDASGKIGDEVSEAQPQKTPEVENPTQTTEVPIEATPEVPKLIPEPEDLNAGLNLSIVAQDLSKRCVASAGEDATSPSKTDSLSPSTGDKRVVCDPATRSAPVAPEESTLSATGALSDYGMSSSVSENVLDDDPKNVPKIRLTPKEKLFKPSVVALEETCNRMLPTVSAPAQVSMSILEDSSRKSHRSSVPSVPPRSKPTQLSSAPRNAAPPARANSSTLPKLPPSVLTSVPPAVLANIPPSVLANIPPGVLSNIPPSVLANIPPEVLASIPSSFWATMGNLQQNRSRVPDLNPIQDMAKSAPKPSSQPSLLKHAPHKVNAAATSAPPSISLNSAANRTQQAKCDSSIRTKSKSLLKPNISGKQGGSAEEMRLFSSLPKDTVVIPTYYVEPGKKGPNSGSSSPNSQPINLSNSSTNTTASARTSFPTTTRTGSPSGNLGGRTSSASPSAPHTSARTVASASPSSSAHANKVPPAPAPGPGLPQGMLQGLPNLPPGIESSMLPSLWSRGFISPQMLAAAAASSGSPLPGPFPGDPQQLAQLMAAGLIPPFSPEAMLAASGGMLPNIGLDPAKVAQYMHLMETQKLSPFMGPGQMNQFALMAASLFHSEPHLNQMAVLNAMRQSMHNQQQSKSHTLPQTRPYKPPSAPKQQKQPHMPPLPLPKQIANHLAQIQPPVYRPPSMTSQLSTQIRPVPPSVPLIVRSAKKSSPATVTAPAPKIAVPVPPQLPQPPPAQPVRPDDPAKKFKIGSKIRSVVDELRARAEKSGNKPSVELLMGPPSRKQTTPTKKVIQVTDTLTIELEQDSADRQRERTRPPLPALLPRKQTMTGEVVLYDVNQPKEDTMAVCKQLMENLLVRVEELRSVQTSLREQQEPPLLPPVSVAPAPLKSSTSQPPRRAKVKVTPTRAETGDLSHRRPAHLQRSTAKVSSPIPASTPAAQAPVSIPASLTVVSVPARPPAMATARRPSVDMSLPCSLPLNKVSQMLDTCRRSTSPPADMPLLPPVLAAGGLEIVPMDASSPPPARKTQVDIPVLPPVPSISLSPNVSLTLTTCRGGPAPRREPDNPILSVTVASSELDSQATDLSGCRTLVIESFNHSQIVKKDLANQVECLNRADVSLSVIQDECEPENLHRTDGSTSSAFDENDSNDGQLHIDEQANVCEVQIDEVKLEMNEEEQVNERYETDPSLPNKTEPNDGRIAIEDNGSTLVVQEEMVATPSAVDETPAPPQNEPSTLTKQKSKKKGSASKGSKSKKGKVAPFRSKVGKKLATNADFERGDTFKPYVFNIEAKHIMDLSDDQRLYTCDICDGVYIRSFSLKRHFLRSHINYAHLSERDINNCGIIVGNKMTLDWNNTSGKTSGTNSEQNEANDRKSNESTENLRLKGVYQCYTCGHCFHIREDLKSHLLSHRTQQEVEESTTSAPESEQKAVENSAPPPSKTPSDPKAGLKLTEKELQLIENASGCEMSSADGEHSERIMKCAGCGLRLEGEENHMEFMRHMYECCQPVGTQSFLCLYCDKVFSTAAVRARHQGRVHQKAVKKPSRSKSMKHACLYCGNGVPAFRDLSSLMEHMCNKHKDVYFGCFECKERYENKNLLTRHYLRVHIALRKLTSVENESNLERVPPAEGEDLIVAEEPKNGEGFNYKCNLCNKSFVSDGNLNRHQRLVHDTSRKDKKKKKKRKEESATQSTTSNAPAENKETDRTENLDPDTVFYSRISSNIRENLMHHLDGKLDSQELFEREDEPPIVPSLLAAPPRPVTPQPVTPRPEPLIPNALEVREKPSPIKVKNIARRRSSDGFRTWEKFSFPKNYDGRGGVMTSYIKDMSHVDIYSQVIMRKNMQKLSTKEVPVTSANTRGYNLRSNQEENATVDFPSLLSLSQSPIGVQNRRAGNADLLGKSMLSVSTSHSEPAKQQEVDRRPRPPKEPAADFLNAAWRQAENTGPGTSAELSGEWVRPKSYICAACDSRFNNLYDLEEHKWNNHPNVWCTHFEFEDAALIPFKAAGIKCPGDLYRRPIGIKGTIVAAPTIETTDESSCTKCNRVIHNQAELHKHMLDCGGDTTWHQLMVAASPGSNSNRRNRKWRPFGSRRRRHQGRRGLKRNIPNTPQRPRSSQPKSRGGDAETIQRMIANLPAKRTTRRVIQFKEDEIKTRSQATISSVPFPMSQSALHKASRALVDRSKTASSSKPGHMPRARALRTQPATGAVTAAAAAAAATSIIMTKEEDETSNSDEVVPQPSTSKKGSLTTDIAGKSKQQTSTILEAMRLAMMESDETDLDGSKSNKNSEKIAKLLEEQVEDDELTQPQQKRGKPEAHKEIHVPRAPSLELTTVQMLAKSMPPNFCAGCQRTFCNNSNRDRHLKVCPFLLQAAGEGMPKLRKELASRMRLSSSSLSIPTLQPNASPSSNSSPTSSVKSDQDAETPDSQAAQRLLFGEGGDAASQSTSRKVKEKKKQVVGIRKRVVKQPNSEGIVIKESFLVRMDSSSNETSEGEVKERSADEIMDDVFESEATDKNSDPSSTKKGKNKKKPPNRKSVGKQSSSEILARRDSSSNELSESEKLLDGVELETSDQIAKGSKSRKLRRSDILPISDVPVQDSKQRRRSCKTPIASTSKITEKEMLQVKKLTRSRNSSPQKVPVMRVDRSHLSSYSSEATNLQSPRHPRHATRSSFSKQATADGNKDEEDYDTDEFEQLLDNMDPDEVKKFDLLSQVVAGDESDSSDDLEPIKVKLFSKSQNANRANSTGETVKMKIVPNPQENLSSDEDNIPLKSKRPSKRKSGEVVPAQTSEEHPSQTSKKTSKKKSSIKMLQEMASSMAETLSDLHSSTSKSKGKAKKTKHAEEESQMMPAPLKVIVKFPKGRSSLTVVPSNEDEDDASPSRRRSLRSRDSSADNESHVSLEGDVLQKEKESDNESEVKNAELEQPSEDLTASVSRKKKLKSSGDLMADSESETVSKSNKKKSKPLNESALDVSAEIVKKAVPASELQHENVLAEKAEIQKQEASKSKKKSKAAALPPVPIPEPNPETVIELDPNLIGELTPRLSRKRFKELSSTPTSTNTDSPKTEDSSQSEESQTVITAKSNKKKLKSKASDTTDTSEEKEEAKVVKKNVKVAVVEETHEVPAQPVKSKKKKRNKKKRTEAATDSNIEEELNPSKRFKMDAKENTEDETPVEKDKKAQKAKAGDISEAVASQDNKNKKRIKQNDGSSDIAESVSSESEVSSQRSQRRSRALDASVDVSDSESVATSVDAESITRAGRRKPRLSEVPPESAKSQRRSKGKSQTRASDLNVETTNEEASLADSTRRGKTRKLRELDTEDSRVANNISNQSDTEVRASKRKLASDPSVMLSEAAAAPVQALMSSPPAASSPTPAESPELASKKRKSSKGSEFYCTVCERHYSTSFNLSKHCNSAFHKTNVALKANEALAAKQTEEENQEVKSTDDPPNEEVVKIPEGPAQRDDAEATHLGNEPSAKEDTEPSSEQPSELNVAEAESVAKESAPSEQEFYPETECNKQVEEQVPEPPQVAEQIVVLPEAKSPVLEREVSEESKEEEPKKDRVETQRDDEPPLLTPQCKPAEPQYSQMESYNHTEYSEPQQRQYEHYGERYDVPQDNRQQSAEQHHYNYNHSTEWPATDSPWRIPDISHIYQTEDSSSSVGLGLGSILDSVNQVLSGDGGMTDPLPMYADYALSDLQHAIGANDEEMAVLRQLGGGSLRDLIGPPPGGPIEEADLLDLDNQVQAAPEAAAIQPAASTSTQVSAAGSRTAVVRSPVPKKALIADSQNVPPASNSARPKGSLSSGPSLNELYEDKQMWCPLCHRRFLGLAAMKTHMESFHTQSGDGRRFERRPLALSAEGSSEPKLCCSVCKEMVVDEKAMDRHIEEMHSAGSRGVTGEETSQGTGLFKESEGLRTQMSSALGGLLDRALKNYLSKSCGPNASNSVETDKSRLTLGILSKLALRHQCGSLSLPSGSGVSIGTTGGGSSSTDALVGQLVAAKLCMRRGSNSSVSSGMSNKKRRASGSNSPIFEVNNSFNCSVCSEKFQFESLLRRHMMVSHKKPSELTDDSLSAPESRAESPVEMSMEPAVGGDGAFLCSACGINFNTPNEVLEHQRVEHQVTRRISVEEPEPTEEAEETDTDTTEKAEKWMENHTKVQSSPKGRHPLGKEVKNKKVAIAVESALLERTEEMRIKAEAALRELNQTRKPVKGSSKEAKWGVDAVKFTVAKEPPLVGVYGPALENESRQISIPVVRKFPNNSRFAFLSERKKISANKGSDEQKCDKDKIDVYDFDESSKSSGNKQDEEKGQEESKWEEHSSARKLEFPSDESTKPPAKRKRVSKKDTSKPADKDSPKKEEDKPKKQNIRKKKLKELIGAGVAGTIKPKIDKKKAKPAGQKVVEPPIEAVRQNDTDVEDVRPLPVETAAAVPQGEAENKMENGLSEEQPVRKQRRASTHDTTDYSVFDFSSDESSDEEVCVKTDTPPTAARPRARRESTSPPKKVTRIAEILDNDWTWLEDSDESEKERRQRNARRKRAKKAKSESPKKQPPKEQPLNDDGDTRSSGEDEESEKKRKRSGSWAVASTSAEPTDIETQSEKQQLSRLLLTKKQVSKGH